MILGEPDAGRVPSLCSREALRGGCSVGGPPPLYVTVRVMNSGSAESPERGDMRNLFLAAFLSDLRKDALKPLDAYQQRWPSFSDEIAEQYRELLESTRRGTIAPAADTPGRSDAISDRTLGPWRILRTIGQGGQGRVYLAQDARLPRQVALKVLHRNFLENAAALQRFAREGNILARLEHPNICAIYDVGSSGQTAWIAMKYIEGDSLSDRIAEKGPPVTRHAIQEILALFERIAAALHTAHEAGVIHRDVKPGNILIDRRTGEPVVVDFGLARGEAPGEKTVTERGEIVGTPSYMSPEQFAPAATLDRRTDVFSLGVTLYQTLTRSLPFPGNGLESIRAAVLGKRPLDPRVRNGALPKALTAVLYKAIEKDPALRYPGAAAFGDDLARVRRGDPPSGTRTRRATKAAYWIRRRPLHAGLAAIGLVCAILAFLLFRSRAELEARRRLPMMDAPGPERIHAPLPRVAPAPLNDLEINGLISEAATLEQHLSECIGSRRFGARALDAIAECRRAVQAFLARYRPRIGITDLRQSANGRMLRDLWGRLEHASMCDDHEASLRTLRHASLDAPEAERAWEEALADVSLLWPWIPLTPLFGFLPIGIDPATRLQEFVYLPSGAAPSRNSDGSLEVGLDAGVIFVLVPGGRFPLGGFRDREQSVSLGPFLLAKSKVTEAQWSRLSTGDGASGGSMRTKVGLSWTEARNVFLRHGLDHPSEAQWEFAARSEWSIGTDSKPTPPPRLGIEGIINTPAEFCREIFARVPTPPRDGDGLRDDPDTETHRKALAARTCHISRRGRQLGNDLTTDVRYRQAADPSNPEPLVALRPVRRLDP